MQSGKTSHSALGHAPLRVPVSVRMMHDLHVLGTCIPKQYSGYHCLLNVCRACSGLGWATIIVPGILAVGKVSLGCIGSELCVRVNTWVMSNIPPLNGQGFKLFVTNIWGCLGSMQLP